jgi:hypothetical protein
MGTRSLTRFIGEDGNPICCLYRQYDGYLDGHGEELRSFIMSKPKGVTNGISGNATEVFNGLASLAAQTVAHFADPKRTGGFYLYGPDAEAQEFNYDLYVTSAIWGCGVGPVNIKINGSWAGEIYDGLVSELPDDLNSLMPDDE